MSNRVLFIKAHVPEHVRHEADGKIVHVRAYNTRATPAIVSFRSGASAPADFRGYVVAGHPVGVSLHEFGPDGAPTNELGQAGLLIERATVMGRKGLWDLAEADLRRAMLVATLLGETA